MPNEMKKEIAKVMMTKVRLFNQFKDKEEYKNNKRKCPFYSELVGMEQMLKIMGIEFEYTFDLETYDITAITIDNDIVVRL